jgi:hypothetical protein
MTLNRQPVATPKRGTEHVSARAGGHRYRLVLRESTWEDAQKHCEELGGHLASVTSQAESEVVSDLVLKAGVDAWIGATDAQKEAVWKWVTGEPFDFTNWYKGEPNNKHNDEHCAMVCGWTGTQWNDYSGNTIRPYVCEWD